MSTDETFSAAASAAGYLYQARLALALCIPYVNSDLSIEVSVERLDDVSFESNGTPIELLQTKHHINRIGSLSDASSDLWKTLRIWSEAVARNPSLPAHTRLLLVTTGLAPVESAAALLRPSGFYSSESRRQPKRAQEILSDVARTSSNEQLKQAFTAFLALTPQMRSSLLSAIEVIDRQPLLSDLDAEIEKALRLVAPRGKATAAREALEGWWWPRISSALMTSPAGRISIAEVEAKIDDIRDQLKRNALVAEFEHANPTDAEVAAFDDFRFVKQLRIIGVGANRISYAKRDYYRAFAQRSKWTREHVVLDTELESFQKRLIEEWEPHFSAMCEELQSELEEENLQKAGQKIYLWIETEARFPLRSLTTRFLTVGSYHMLANDLLLGWHRDYIKLFSEES